MQPNAKQQTAGIKIAQAGFNAKSCPDYDLIFNSSWPSLAIVYDQLATITYDNLGSPTPAIIDHNLGFYPLTMAWQFTDNTRTVSTGRIFPDIAKNKIYLPTALAFSQTVYLNIKCYNLDITAPQFYNYLQSPAVNNVYDPTYGIKVVKQNTQITSTDMRSFILHSRCASPQVLAVVTETVKYNAGTGIGNNNGTLTYTNPQNYTPWAFGYGATLSGGNLVYRWAPPNAQAYPTISLFNGVIRLGGIVAAGSNPGKGSLIILRDPFFVANSVSVVY